MVDKRGQQTAVLLDLPTWRALQQILEELLEDEKLGELMAAVQNDEKLEGEAAREAYSTYLREKNQKISMSPHRRRREILSRENLARESKVDY